MMSDLLDETNVLIQGAAVGQLNKRANADLFQGGWNQLVVGVNETVRNIAETAASHFRLHRPDRQGRHP